MKIWSPAPSSLIHCIEHRNCWKIKQNQENFRRGRVQEGGDEKLQGRKGSRRRSWKTPGEEGFMKEDLENSMGGRVQEGEVGKLQGRKGS